MTPLNQETTIPYVIFVLLKMKGWVIYIKQTQANSQEHFKNREEKEIRRVQSEWVCVVAENAYCLHRD